MDDTNILINSEFIELVIKSNYIFNDLLLTSKPRVVKASSKSDKAVI